MARKGKVTHRDRIRLIASLKPSREKSRALGAEIDKSPGWVLRRRRFIDAAMSEFVLDPNPTTLEIARLEMCLYLMEHCVPGISGEVGYG